ncbi:MAG: LacI family DNA-binding transcriptional regulator [Anaerolineales bacterium]|nr:LacI family DNA-binding transcriptional regulator [Anaerolineales bacterium]MDD5466284.1 LacI family DNA-binding transcriptional regulator [Anaerolineales bacterium]
MKRVTINDVATTAGVSKSTVSHVINKTRFVEEATRQKVLAAIASLEYRPSNIARSLVSKRTKTAGLLISDVGNPFYSEVILGAEEVAMLNDYSIFLCNTSYDLERGMKYIHSLIDKSVDGLLFMSSSMSLEMVEEVVKNQIQAVVFDWEDVHLDNLAATITINFREGIREAVRHLVESGHREISHISGPLDLWTAQVRRDAFLDSLREYGLDPKRSVVIEGDLRIEGGRNAFEQLIQIKPRPTAVFAANDLMALGVLWAARNYGFNLPEQLSVVGLDDIDLASKVTPALTTVALPRYDMGKLAMKTLLDMIEKPTEKNGGKLEVATRLIVRQSTAPPAGAWAN